jgi:prepilin-type N-terminal cleavage/methylation domain-containing protein
VTRQSGFTLLELAVVLVIVGVLSAVTIPAFSAGPLEDPAAVGASEVVSLLRTARSHALGRAQPVTLRIDVRTRMFILAAESGDSIEQIAQGIVTLPQGTTLGATASSALFRFASTGAARGDTLFVRGGGPAVAVWVDRWTGAPHVRQ